MKFAVEIEQEVDGRWIAEIPQIPGAMAYGSTREEAVARAEALGLRVLAEDPFDRMNSMDLIHSEYFVNSV